MNGQARRRWLITGVSTGLGRSVMEAVLRRGDDVVGTVRTLPDHDPAQDIGPGRLKLIRLDITDPASIATALPAAAEWLGGIDVLVNNAGAGMFGPVEVCSVEDFARVMEVNYFGLVNVTRAALPYLRESKGVLVNVASMAAMLAMGGTAPYAASKHAVLGLSEALAGELEPFGIRVIVPMPGGFRTNFWSERSNVIREGLEDVYAMHPAGQIRAQSSAHRGNEMGDPAKLAEALIDVVGASNPPLYLVLGGDALDYVGAKRDAIAADVERMRSVAVSTAFG
jgi:NAD(P)-dependent dehydrogenase (short-subunit alcohol dehydrogenase family)